VTPIEGELVSGLQGPWQLAVDVANVYFTTEDKLMACRKSGCNGTATELATVQGVVGGIVSDDAEVFWTDSAGTVNACPVAGCAGQPRLVAAVKSPAGLALASGTLYWTTDDGLVQRCATSCAAPETLATEAGQGLLWGIAVSGESVFWTREGMYDGTGWTGALRTCSLERACVPRTLADRQNNARTLAVQDNTAAWVSDGESTVRRCTLPGCTDVTAMPLAGQLGVAMTGGKIYWSYASGGWIQATSYAGDGITEVVTGQQPTFLATDSTNLYWISTDIADSRGGIAGTGKVVSRRLAP
jgi:hypothetical protein